MPPRHLRVLHVEGNQLDDSGCAQLGSAVDGGALLDLKVLNVAENPASDYILNIVQYAPEFVKLKKKNQERLRQEALSRASAS